MNILLSNDDGVDAPGLAALRAAVADLGDIAVVAPASPQSASGHSITLRQPLAVGPVRLRDAAGNTFEGLSVDGRPADCVRLAVRELLAEPIELVLSGINAGANVGINVFYSGTVAAAAEGAMLGLPAVALSVGLLDGQADFARAARLCRWVLDRLLAGGLAPCDLINVNIPPAPLVPRGVRVVPQSTAEVEDTYHEHPMDNGQRAYRLNAVYSFADHTGDTDVRCLAAGYITVTPLHLDMTNHDRLSALGRRRWDDLPR